VRYALIAVFSGTTLLAQINPRELVRQSIVNGEKAWRESRAYSYLKLETDKQFGSGGQVKSVDRDLYKIIPVNGDSFQEHIRHDGEPVSADEMRKQEQELLRREHETPAQQAALWQREERDRSYYDEIPNAFDFKIVGQENMPTGPAWILWATPRAGFVPHSRYAHVFPKMEGRLWIDKKDIQWVKADAMATDNIYFGYFIARLSKGSHIVLEQTKLPDGTWVPKLIRAKADARTFFFFNHNFEEDITYSDYHKGNGLVASTTHK
jgi:hypothetical protein